MECFVSLRPCIKMVKKWVPQKWKLKGCVSVVAMPRELFLSKFIAQGDLAMVLLGTQYYGNPFLVIAKWFLSFDPSSELS